MLSQTYSVYKVPSLETLGLWMRHVLNVICVQVFIEERYFIYWLVNLQLAQIQCLVLGWQCLDTPRNG